MERLLESPAKGVFENFKKISMIPRCSNDEEKISNFIYEFGLNLNLETKRDEFGNVLIIKPATNGYEDSESVCLQAHLDMVCEKTEESYHNFTCDPISLVVDGDYLRAKDTTLGADDGAGVALMMSILEDKTLSHPRLECLFTTTEETGMDGAIGVSENWLTSKNLINLDNEEDWIIIVGCAGGINAYINKELEKENINGLINYKIKISGLLGGHSGSMIHEARLNAIKLLDYLLLKLKNKLNFNLAEIQGGSKHNAIPSLAYAIIGINSEDIEILEKSFNEISLEMKDLYLKRELDLKFELLEENKNYSYIEDELATKILRFIQVFPHGVNTMDKDLDIVKSSNNLAILKTDDNNFYLQTSIRSSDDTDLEYLKNEILNLSKLNNFNIKFSEGYPMWKPNFDNHLLSVAKDTYRELRDEEIKVLVIHAGLETGILSQKYPNMNMISMGPTIIGAHTPNEKLSIKSMEFSYKYLKTLLKNL